MSISIQAQGRLKIIIIMQEPRDRFKTTFQFYMISHFTMICFVSKVLRILALT